MEGICLELAGQAALPEEHAGLCVTANNYRATILKAEAGDRFANTAHTGLFQPITISA